MSRLGLGVLAVVAAMVVGCGPSAVGNESLGSGSSSGALDESGLDGSATGSTAWPDESYGAFYLVTSFPLGRPENALAFLSNLDLGHDDLVVTHLNCRGEMYNFEERFAVEYEGAEVHVRPRDGDSQVIWRGAPLGAELIFRPGADCTELRTEIVDPDPGAAGFAGEMVWTRGALVVTDPCNDDPNDHEWAADLRPEVPTDCPSGG